jgi:CRISPR-associated protein Csx17
MSLSSRVLGMANVVSDHEYKLEGVRVQPLGHYLAGLGLLRLVNRTIDPQAKGFWREGDFWLQTKIAQDELVSQIVDSYRALHIINPWNKAAGISIDGTVATFAGLFLELGNSPCVRLEGLK